MITKETTGANLRELTEAFHLPLERAQRCALRWAAVEENDRILDIDCGSGALLLDLTNRMRIRACGMCRDWGEARQLREMMDGADVICGKPADIPFRDDSFDTVFVTRRTGENCTLNGLKEIYRVLRPGAQLIICCHMYPRLSGLAAQYAEPELDRRTLMRSMQECGFRHISCRQSGWRGVIFGWKKEAFDSTL